MIQILFVCHGNICRSPMAEYIMKDKVKKAGLEDDFFIASAATHTDVIGDPVYPPAAKLLNAAGIDCSAHAARLLRASDYETYDLLIGMDEENMRSMDCLFNGDPDNKIKKLSEYVGSSADIDDPWYTLNFNKTWDEINIGCDKLIKELTERK